MNKPREFWIFPDADYSREHISVSKKDGDSMQTMHDTKLVHVIEYSAYEAQQYSMGDLLTECQRLFKELEAERARNAKLVEALESLISHSHSWLITEQNGAILSITHKSYRDKIEKALAANKET